QGEDRELARDVAREAVGHVEQRKLTIGTERGGPVAPIDQQPPSGEEYPEPDEKKAAGEDLAGDAPSDQAVPGQRRGARADGNGRRTGLLGDRAGRHGAVLALAVGNEAQDLCRGDQQREERNGESELGGTTEHGS